MVINNHRNTLTAAAQLDFEESTTKQQNSRRKQKAGTEGK